MTQILLSILVKDKRELQQKLQQVEGLVKEVQIDIADNTFVQNKTIDIESLETVKTSLRYELHLMIKQPEEHIKNIPKNTTTIIFHAEATKKHIQLIKKIKQKGLFAGVAINPDTSVMSIKHLFAFVDQILVMTVQPGFYGGTFLPHTLKKVEQLRKLREQKRVSFLIEVDGGQDEKHTSMSKDAGADKIVVGSYIFKSKNVKKTIEELEKI